MNGVPLDAATSLPPAIRTVLDELDVPESARSKIYALVIGISQHNDHLPDGPWIAPDSVHLLEELCPGFAERYTTLLLERGRVTLLQAEHEIDWEKQEQTILRDNQNRGMNFGLVIALALIAGAVFCAMVGATAIGIALVGAAALGMVSKFIDGAHRK